MAMYDGCDDTGQGTCSNFSLIFCPNQLWAQKKTRYTTLITLKHFISLVSFVVLNKMQLKHLTIM